MAKKKLSHDPRLDDPSKIQIAGYKVSDLIRIASMLKNSDSWRLFSSEIFMAMSPVMYRLASADNKRINERKSNSISDLARNITDRQSQKLRILHMILGWTLHEISLESEVVRAMLNEWQVQSMSSLTTELAGPHADKVSIKL